MKSNAAACRGINPDVYGLVTRYKGRPDLIVEMPGYLFAWKVGLRNSQLIQRRFRADLAARKYPVVLVSPDGEHWRLPTRRERLNEPHDLYVRLAKETVTSSRPLVSEKTRSGGHVVSEHSEYYWRVFSFRDMPLKSKSLTTKFSLAVLDAMRNAAIEELNFRVPFVCPVTFDYPVAMVSDDRHSWKRFDDSRDFYAYRYFQFARETVTFNARGEPSVDLDFQTWPKPARETDREPDTSSRLARIKDMRGNNRPN